MKGYWKNTRYMLRLVWSISKGRIIGTLLASAEQYISWVFYSIVFIKFLMEALETGKSFREIMIFLVGSTLVMMAIDLYGKWYMMLYEPKTKAKVYEGVNRLLFDKATEVDLSCYEDTEFYNRFTLAMKDSEEKISSVVQTTAAISTGMVAAVFSLYYMYSIDHFVIIFVLGPIIGNFVFGRKLNKKMYEQNKENVPNVRRMEYVNRVMYLPDYAKELRMTNIFQVLKSIHSEGYAGIFKNIRKYAPGKINLAVWRNIFTFVVIFQGVIFYSLYRVLVSHSIMLSDFVVLFSAMNTVSWILIGVSNYVITSYQNSLYVANFREFLEYEPMISERQEGSRPDTELCDGEPELEFKNVSFVYKGQKEPTLKNVSMTIHHKEKIAIVGHNGAGKTTFTKLLMRLYDPSEGGITYHGENIKGFNLAEYRRLYVSAFQDYQVFAMTVAENVLMRTPQGENDYALAEQALKNAGIWEKVESLPKGMDTVLTKEFAEDGAVLSGGEMQKIAVARTFARDYKIAVFDEPSSALDPVAEYRLYESIMKSCEDKTVVFISHRLSTAVLADRIYLFENGEIAEQGTHEELMQRNGLYAEMFTKQAEKYRGGMAE